MTALFSTLKKKFFFQTGRLLSMAKFFKNLREKLSELIYNLAIKNGNKNVELIRE
jgi:predicted butyrate kinase (DUF1464 family)